MNLSELKTGDVILFHTPFKVYKPMTWLAAAIRLFTKSYYNHAGVVVINWGVPFLNEAVATGIVTTPIKDRINGSIIRVGRRNDLEVNDEFFAPRANDKLGHTGYDFSSLFFFQVIYQLTGQWLGHTGDAADDRLYCGEYVGFMHQDVFMEWWKTTPADINKSKSFDVVFEGKYNNQ